MSMRQVECAHPALGSAGLQKRFRFYELTDHCGLYAVAALAEHADCLELHLEVLRYGPSVARRLRADAADLRDMARRLGKQRIVGLRTEDGVELDPRWAKFTRLFGFTGQRAYQTAEMIVG